MRQSRFSEEQIVGILKEQPAGLPVAEVCRRHGINDAAFYTWRSRFGGMAVSDTRRLKALDEENCTLKKFLAEVMLEVATLRAALGKNFWRAVHGEQPRAGPSRRRALRNVAPAG
ncbi:putative transposase [Methylorubrum extorquens]